MSDKTIRITLTAWRQAGPDAEGGFETYDVPGVSPDRSMRLFASERSAKTRSAG